MAGPRALASPISRYIMIAGAGTIGATGLAIWADQRPEPNADGTSKGRIDRKEALDATTGIRSGVGIASAAVALLAISQLYSASRVSLRPLELALLKGTYALSGGVVVGAGLAGPVFNRAEQYDTRHIPVP